MSEQHQAHPSGLPITQTEHGWGLFVRFSAGGYLDVQGLASAADAESVALAALRAYCGTRGLSSDGDGAALLARLVG